MDINRGEESNRTIMWIQGEYLGLQGTYKVPGYEFQLRNQTDKGQAGLQVLVASTQDTARTKDEIDKCAECVSDLISIAYGTFVSWSKIGTQRQRAIEWECERDFATASVHELIDFRNLQQFFNETWSELYAMSPEERRLWRKLNHSIAVGRSEPIYPVPFLLLQATIEELTSSELILKWEKSYYIDNPSRRKTRPDLKDWLRRGIMTNTDESTWKQFESELPNKVEALFLKSFRERARALFDLYEVFIDDGHLKDFTSKRNSTHKGYQYEQGDWKIWSRVASPLQYLLLKKLGYTGPYYDYSKAPRQLTTMKVSEGSCEFEEGEQ